MDTREKEHLDPKFIVKAINIDTDEIICQGSNGDEVMKLAEESGKNYILDFESEPRHNFYFD